MVATGRVPNTANMGLEAAGIEATRGFVCVEEKMRVKTSHADDASTLENVYGIGDANGKMMLAHAARLKNSLLFYSDNKGSKFESK